MSKTSDPVAQRIHRENVERMLLASFVSGLTGTPGKQVRYTGTRDIVQALSIGLAVQETEKQERFNESFYAKFDNSVRLSARSPSRPRQDDDKSQPHLTRQLSITCVVSATNLRTALASQQPHLPGMHRRKIKSGVMSAKG